MNDHVSQSILLTTKVSRHLETLLKKEFGAEGTGLHSYTTSVEHLLSPSTVKKLRWLASVRNNVQHTHGAVVDDMQGYEAAYRECVETLNALIEHRRAEEARARRRKAAEGASRKSSSHVRPNATDSDSRRGSANTAVSFMVVGLLLGVVVVTLLNGRYSRSPTTPELSPNTGVSVGPLASDANDNDGDVNGSDLGRLSINEGNEPRSRAVEQDAASAVSAATGEAGGGEPSSVDIAEPAQPPTSEGVPEMELKSDWSPRTPDAVATDSSAPVDQSGTAGTGSRSTGSAVLEMPEGALLSRAARSDELYRNARREVQREIWGYLRANMEVSVGDPEMRPRKDGRYDLLVPLRWQVDPEPVMLVLNRYFHGSSGRRLEAGRVDFRDHMSRDKSYGVKVRRYVNDGDRQKTPFSAELYQYLVSRPLRIVVTTGSHEGVVTIASGRDCHVSCRGVGDSQFHLHFSNRDDPGAVIFRGREQNPVVVSGLRQADIEAIDSIQAEVVLD